MPKYAEIILVCVYDFRTVQRYCRASLRAAEPTLPASRYASLLPDVEVPFGGQTVVVGQPFRHPAGSNTHAVNSSLTRYKCWMHAPGDTHGQLEDVLTIFLAHGTPSNRNRLGRARFQMEPPAAGSIVVRCLPGISSMVTLQTEAMCMQLPIAASYC